MLPEFRPRAYPWVAALALVLAAGALLEALIGVSAARGARLGQVAMVADAVLTHPTAASELVLRVEIRGGFVLPRDLLTAVPLFSLYGDGRLISKAPEVASYPGPALPKLQVTRLSEAGIQAVLHEASRAGLLDGDRELLEAGVPDAGTTVFTVVAQGQVSRVSAYALGLDPDPAALDADGAARAKLVRFLELLSDRSWLPSTAIIEPDAGLPPERLQIVAQPVDADGATAPVSDAAAPPMSWPLVTPLARFGAPFDPRSLAASWVLPGLQCGVVEGADAERLAAALRRASELTPWQSDGMVFLLYPRPLLPDEVGCPPRSLVTPTP